MRKLSLLFLVINIVSTSGFTQNLTPSSNTKPTLVEANPSSAGYSTERLKRIDQTIQEYVDKKSITSTAVMMLYEEGKFLLDDPISQYIPEFAKPTQQVPNSHGDLGNKFRVLVYQALD